MRSSSIARRFLLRLTRLRCLALPTRSSTSCAGHTRTETATEGLKQFIDAQAPVAGIAVSRVVVKEYRRYGHHDLSYTRAPVATFG